ncbi:MAG TPA: HlyD family efflux transporter periplasmic adaptor subunit [Pseudonocardiaceae bacterium]|nr:HlyD family efflux transporter periplasmic adaptor subunit [Pseudonocardiaceae bacterium]
MADKRTDRRHRANRRRLIIGAVVLVLLLGGAGGVWAATRPSGDSYRTVAAGPATVTDALGLTGAIEPVSEATVDFPVSGQVAAVDVTQGQQVTAGQTLAQLNTTSLAGQVSSSQSSVATAQARLAADQASQTSAVGGTGSSTGSAAGSSSQPAGTVTDPPASSRPATDTAALASLNSGQAAVREAQAAVDADLTVAKAAVKQENTTCGPVIQSLQAVPAAPTTRPTTPTAPPTTSTATGTTTPASTVSAQSAQSAQSAPSGPNPTEAANCAALLQQALDDQGHTSTDEQALATAESALTVALNRADSAVAQAAQSASAKPSTSASSTGSSRATSSGANSGSSSSGSTRSGGSGNSGQPASADQLAADQAQVDSANAQLASLQQNQAAATLVSPIAGTVAQVGLTGGQSVSAGSSTDSIVVIGPGTSEVTTAVDDSQVGKVRPGEVASVIPDGVTTPLAGTVTAIGALGSTTSSGSASYPVTISLAPTTVPLFAGANATVSITLGSAAAAVTVPTSAVHSVGSVSFVSVLRSGKPTLVPVTLGVTGSTVTQVTSGLIAGEQVVLADISTPLPTSGSTNTRAITGGGAGRGAGGGAGGAGGGQVASVPKSGG